MVNSCAVACSSLLLPVVVSVSTAPLDGNEPSAVGFVPSLGVVNSTVGVASSLVLKPN